MDRKTIKRRLRELAADPGQPGAAAEVQRLKGALRRLSRPEPPARPAPEPAPAADPDAEAIATWPPELRVRLQQGAMSRVIAPWRD
ncbi:hypothetical protein OG252_07520 [Streptomyces sp. NBC_01352]|uniref:hypothetical protein n=1 Tax=Streptomyces sp. NBC_01352 TaxID=2903834 RepID=UPI002E376D2F|nr:hypothetical protein [Streptomyces sp. NBC_01352]